MIEKLNFESAYQLPLDEAARLALERGDNPEWVEKVVDVAEDSRRRELLADQAELDAKMLFLD